MKLFRVINYDLMQSAAVFDEHIFILVLTFLNVCPGLGANPPTISWLFWFVFFDLTDELQCTPKASFPLRGSIYAKLAYPLNGVMFGLPQEYVTYLPINIAPHLSDLSG